MRKIAVFLGIIMMSLSLFANEEWYSNLNPRFDEKSNAMILDVNSPCNQGGEPFYEFLGRFDDSAFVKERFRLPSIDSKENKVEEEPWLPGELTITRSEWCIMYTEEFPFWQEYAASWFDVTADRVCHIYGEPMPDGSIIVGSLCVFKRIDGTWYFVGFAGI